MDILNMTKKAAIELFKEKLKTNSAWALKGLTTIYEFQTENEKGIGVTVESNGLGFSGVDSEILSSFARQVNSGYTLSVRQMAVVHKCMPKYAGQLYKVAKSKAEYELETKSRVSFAQTTNFREVAPQQQLNIH